MPKQRRAAVLAPGHALAGHGVPDHARQRAAREHGQGEDHGEGQVGPDPDEEVVLGRPGPPGDPGGYRHSEHPADGGHDRFLAEQPFGGDRHGEGDAAMIAARRPPRLLPMTKAMTGRRNRRCPALPPPAPERWGAAPGRDRGRAGLRARVAVEVGRGLATVLEVGRGPTSVVIRNRPPVVQPMLRLVDRHGDLLPEGCRTGRARRGGNGAALCPRSSRTAGPGHSGPTSVPKAPPHTDRFGPGRQLPFRGPVRTRTRPGWPRTGPVSGPFRHRPAQRPQRCAPDGATRPRVGPSPLTPRARPAPAARAGPRPPRPGRAASRWGRPGPGCPRRR